MSFDASEELDVVDLKDLKDEFFASDIGKVSQESQHVLENLLQNRMNRKQFEDKFVKQEFTSDSIFNRTRRLGGLLAQRPTKDKLVNNNIIHDTQGASSNLAAARTSLRNEQRKNKLAQLITQRPTLDQLKKLHIIVDEDDRVAKKHDMEQAKAVIGDFISHRPSPEQLVKQNIITDIGDLPSITERKVESNQLVPFLVESLQHITVKQVSCGFSHTAVVDVNGLLYTFGSSLNGRLGLGSSENHANSNFHTPQLVTSLQSIGPVTYVDCGDNHSAAIVAGQLYTWGTGSWGRLGTGSQDDQTVPTHVQLFHEPSSQTTSTESIPSDQLITSVSCGAYHTIVLTNQHQVYAFGWNKNGRCGVGKRHPQASSLSIVSPILIPTLSKSSGIRITQIAAGQGVSGAIDDKGQLYTWGAGTHGALGHGDENDQWEPKLISTLKDVTQVAVGASHVLALTKESHLYSWGHNNSKQLGRETDEKQLHVPVRISFDASNITQIACGKSHSALIQGGHLLTWGIGTRGVLGSGSERDIATPTLVSSLSSITVTSVACSWVHTAIVTNYGKLYTCGSKQHTGQLGYL